MMTPLRLAYLSLARKKTSTLIGLVAIALSVATSGVLLRLFILSDSRFQTLGKGGDVIIGAKAGNLDILLGSLNFEAKAPDFLPENLFRTLQASVAIRFEDGAKAKADFVKGVVPMLFFAETLHGAPVVGTDDSFFKRPSREDDIPLSEGRLAETPSEVVVGSGLWAEHGYKLGDSIFANTLSKDSETLQLKIVGALKSTGTVFDRGVFARLDYGQQALFANNQNTSIWNHHVLSYILVYLNPGGWEKLQSLINQRSVGQAVKIEEAKAKLEELTGVGRELGLLMTLLTIALGGLCVATLLISRFDAMSVQLAVLRAMGYRKVEVAATLLIEGLMLGVLSAGVGAALDGFLFPLIREHLSSALPPPSLVAVPLFASFPVWLAAIVASQLAVLIPLVKLYRQDVHTSLKGL